MILHETTRARALAILLFLAALMLVWFGAASPYLAALSRSGQQLAAANTQLQIYRRAALRDSVGAAGRPSALAGILLPGRSRAAAAANLQQSLGLLIANSGAMLLSFELLPAAKAEDVPLEAIIGRIRLTANTPSLQVVLHAMEVHRPLLVLDNIFVRARSDQDTVPGGHLDIQMDVSGYRQASP